MFLRLLGFEASHRRAGECSFSAPLPFDSEPHILCRMWDESLLVIREGMQKTKKKIRNSGIWRPSAQCPIEKEGFRSYPVPSVWGSLIYSIPEHADEQRTTTYSIWAVAKAPMWWFAFYIKIIVQLIWGIIMDNHLLICDCSIFFVQHFHWRQGEQVLQWLCGLRPTADWRWRRAEGAGGESNLRSGEEGHPRVFNHCW